MKICPVCQRENADNVGFCAHCGAVLPATPGQASPYAPPPVAPRRGRSPWLWVGLGCGLFTLLIVGAIIAVGYVAAKRIAEETKKPLSAQQVTAALQDVPIYPGAQVDIEMSKAMRAGFGIAGTLTGGKVRFDIGVFQAPAPADKVIAWYEKTLPGKGWKPAARAPSGFNNSASGVSQQRQFVQGDRQLVVQTGSGKRQRGAGSADGNEKGTMLILTQIVGLPSEK